MKSENTQEIVELASAVCDQCASDTQIRRLETLLDQCPDAQKVYANYMLMHAELFWQQESLYGAADNAASNAKSKATSFSGLTSVRGSLWSLAAMLLVGGLVGAVLVWSLNRSDILSGLADGRTISDFGEQVAVVSQTVNCLWSVDDDVDSAGGRVVAIGYGSDLYAGQQINLMEGAAEITFNSGVRIILEAPAVLDLASDFESILHQGRMTASVPKGAEGFEVACNGITLVDRGTEFGVNADRSGETEVQVFDGLVEGHLKDSAGITFKKVSWKTNEKALFNPATNEFRDVDRPVTFMRSLSPAGGSGSGLLVAEEFDYPVGRLGGQNGGFGWGGPWEDISFVEGIPESNGIGAGGISLRSSGQIGNHALLSGQYNRIRRNLSTSYSGVFDTAGLIELQDGIRLVGKEGTTIFIGFVQRISKVDDVFYGFELNRGDGNRNRVLCVGHGAARAWLTGPPRSPDKTSGVTKWSVTSEYNGTENQLLELGSLGSETTDPSLIVMKLEFGANNEDKVSVYLNPSCAADELQSEPIIVGHGNFAFDRIGIANFEGDKSFEVDNVRIGKSFSSVACARKNGEAISSVK